MKNINYSTPAPGTVVHLFYVAKDNKMTERLVLITSADAAHWRGVDLAKSEPRCFRREGLAVAERVETREQQQAILERLVNGLTPS